MDKFNLVIIGIVAGVAVLIGALVYNGVFVNHVVFCDTLTSIGGSSWGTTSVSFAHGQVAQIQNLPNVVIVGHPYDVISNGNGVLSLHIVNGCSP